MFSQKQQSEYMKALSCSGGITENDTAENILKSQAASSGPPFNVCAGNENKTLIHGSIAMQSIHSQELMIFWCCVLNYLSRNLLKCSLCHCRIRDEWRNLPVQHLLFSSFIYICITLPQRSSSIVSPPNKFCIELVLN